MQEFIVYFKWFLGSSFSGLNAWFSAGILLIFLVTIIVVSYEIWKTCKKIGIGEGYLKGIDSSTINSKYPDLLETFNLDSRIYNEGGVTPRSV